MSRFWEPEEYPGWSQHPPSPDVPDNAASREPVPRRLRSGWDTAAIAAAVVAVVFGLVLVGIVIIAVVGMSHFGTNK